VKVTSVAPEGWEPPVLELDDSYPSDLSILAIEDWPYDKPKELLDAVRGIWQYADCGYWEVDEHGAIHASTGGWSGNEEIIGALQRNVMIWGQIWLADRRGGHYILGTGYRYLGGNSDDLKVRFEVKGK